MDDTIELFYRARRGQHLSASCRWVPLLSCWHRYTRALRAPGSRGPALAVWSSAPNHGAVFSMH